jgi:hypothetical protein
MAADIRATGATRPARRHYPFANFVGNSRSRTATYAGEDWIFSVGKLFADWEILAA